MFLDLVSTAGRRNFKTYWRMECAFLSVIFFLKERSCVDSLICCCLQDSLPSPLVAFFLLFVAVVVNPLNVLVILDARSGQILRIYEHNLFKMNPTPKSLFSPTSRY